MKKKDPTPKFRTPRSGRQQGRPLRRITEFTFESGEVYLFHRCSPQCDPQTSLWGMFDKLEGQTVYLESSSLNLIHFTKWHSLPAGYRYCRKSERHELRDYMTGLLCNDMEILRRNATA